MAEATKKAPAKASESDKALHTPAQQKPAGKTVSKSDAKALDKRRQAQQKYTDGGGPDPQLYDEQAEHAQKVTATKQMMNTSDGTATEIDGVYNETPDYDDNVEVPEAVHYNELQHDPEDVEYSDFPHAGVAEDDPAGVDEDDPAGSAPKDDNYEGDAAAVAKERAKEAEKAAKDADQNPRTATSQQVNTTDGTAKEPAKAKKD